MNIAIMGFVCNLKNLPMYDYRQCQRYGIDTVIHFMIYIVASAERSPQSMYDRDVTAMQGTTAQLLCVFSYYYSG